MKKLLAVMDSVDIYGKERANIQVYHILNENDYDVCVAYNENANNLLKTELSFFDIRPVAFPRNLDGRFRAFKYAANFLKSTVQFAKLVRNEKPDFILIPTEIALLYLIIPLKLTHAKVIFRMGDDPLTYRKRNKWPIKIYRILWKHIVLKRIDAVVSNAKYIQRRMAYSGRLPSTNDKLIYNYPPIRKNVCSVVLPFEKNNRVKIGFIGRIVEDKGVIVLVQAALELLREGYELELYIAGNLNVDIEYANRIQSLIKDSGIHSNNIRLLGNVNDVKQFYEHIDVVCVPSIYEEPMANVVTEAKMYSKPCVIFNLGGMPEIISHREDGYICEDVSVDSLKKAFVYYITDREELKREGQNAFNSINKLGLNKSSFDDRWLTLFKTIK